MTDQPDPLISALNAIRAELMAGLVNLSNRIEAMNQAHQRDMVALQRDLMAIDRRLAAIERPS